MRLVTSFGPEGYSLYGKRFIESCLKHWDIPLTVYVEDFNAYPEGPEYKAVTGVPGLVDYLKRPQIQSTSKIKGYQFDVFKFCRKSYIQANEINRGGKFFWIDADVVIDVEPPENILDELLEDYPIAYMPRDDFYCCSSLLGFDGDQCKDFAKEYIDIYESGRVFDLNQWHDCMVLEEALRTTGIKTKSLTENCEDKGPVANVFNEVFPWGHHNKGNLKYQIDNWLYTNNVVSWDTQTR